MDVFCSYIHKTTVAAACCFAGLILIFVFSLNTASAKTDIGELVITKNTTWSAAAGPYNVAGDVTIEKGTTLTVSAGSVINLSGKFYIKGSLVFKGSGEKTVIINESPSSSGFIVYGGTLDIDNASISAGAKIIDAYASSTVVLTNSSIKGLSESFLPSSSISIWQSSSLFMDNSVIQDIQPHNVIEVFNGGSITVKNSSFTRAGSRSTIIIYDNSLDFSVGDIQSSVFSDSAVGLQVFNRASVEVSDSEFKKMSGSGLFVHSGGSVAVSSSTISENKIGIESYDSNVSISQSSIEKNTEYGAFVARGVFNSTHNWWGDESGPHQLVVNLSGKGDEVEGSDNVDPWLTEKPKKQTPCCSNVLFIPGLQGSRIYKRQLFSENQLWEPNRNADIKKLFLDNSGAPLDASLYTKDIINRTNIGFGFFDKDIYKPFTDSLDARVKNYYMREWRPFPYDWRMSPEDIVTKTVKVGSKNVLLEEAVRELAVNASNKKVTIVAHSYGGLIAQAFLKKLEEEGRSSLVDKVIMVCAPEEGSVDAVAALLHGDGQELGHGFIVKADIARSLGINMPSAYYLLPSQVLLSWLSGPVIRFDTSASSGSNILNHDTNTVFGLDAFLKNEGNIRSASKGSADIQQPAKLNAYLTDKARGQRSLIGGSSSIDVIQILGTGLKTVKALSYKNIACSDNQSTTAAFFGVLSCGLNHTNLYTDSGDGTVLTGDISARKGSKLIFDLASYNSYAHLNYGHTDMISSRPIIETIGAILGGGPYPPITSWGDYVKFVPDAVQPDGAEYAASLRHEAYQISASKNVLLSAVAADGKTTGFLEQLTDGYSFPAISQIPNSSFGLTDSRPYVISEESPEHVSIKSLAGDASMISVEGIKISPAVSSLDGTSTVLFSFDDIPMSPDTNILIDHITPPNRQTASTSPIMHIDRDGDGVFESSFSYTSNKAELAARYIQGNQTSGGGAGSTPIATSTLLITPEAALQRLRSNIASSTVSRRFIERYLTRTNPVSVYIKKNQTASALSTAARTSTSLAAIVKELSRARSRYYNGGLTKTEATYLYFSWADFTSAMKNIMSLK